MAYRRGTRKKTRGRSYGARKTGRYSKRASAPRRRARTGSRQQTLRVVIEQAPAAQPSAVSGDIHPVFPGKRSRF